MFRVQHPGKHSSPRPIAPGMSARMSCSVNVNRELSNMWTFLSGLVPTPSDWIRLRVIWWQKIDNTLLLCSFHLGSCNFAWMLSAVIGDWMHYPASLFEKIRGSGGNPKSHSIQHFTHFRHGNPSSHIYRSKDTDMKSGGSCKTIGSFSSWGIHMKHLDLGNWK
jgi:hypothetical protein